MENTYPQESNSWSEKEKSKKLQYFKHLESKRMMPLREYSVMARLLIVGILVAISGLAILFYVYNY